MQSLGQSSVTSRCSPQHCGQMREWTAGQKRFSFLVSQRLQGTIQFLTTDIVESLERFFRSGISSKGSLE